MIATAPVKEALDQGVYPTRGVDRWIAFSFFDRAEIQRLSALVGCQWPDPEAAPDAFDAQLAELTREHDDLALMERLRAAGIAAGVVQDIDDVLERDPQLRARPRAWHRRRCSANTTRTCVARSSAYPKPTTPSCSPLASSRDDASHQFKYAARPSFWSRSASATSFPI